MKFNDTVALDTRYRSLIRQDFANNSPEKAFAAVKDSLGPLPSINWKLNDSWGFIRARMIDETKEDISDLAAFGTPPVHLTPEGRANLVGQPAFYGTFDARTAMQEIKVPKDSECMVSTWEFKNTPATVSTFLRHANKKNDLYPLDIKLRDNIPKNLLGTYTSSSFKRAMLHRSSIFTHDNYALSARLAHHAIYDNAFETDGIIYPSVIDPYRNNVALNPDYVSEHMQCVRIYKMVWSGAFIFRMLARGIPQDGNRVLWQETGTFELDALDQKYSGGFGPNEIHPDALGVLHND
jgi:hypothetical protein